MFERLQEQLDKRVVIGIPRACYRPHRPRLLKAFTEASRRVLGSAACIVDGAGERAAALEGGVPSFRRLPFLTNQLRCVANDASLRKDRQKGSQATDMGYGRSGYQH